MAKVSRPIVYTALFGVVAYAAVVLTEPEPAPGTGRRTPAGSREAAAQGQFLPEDYSASFAKLNEPARNAFKPLVARSRGANAGENARVDAVPADFAGGDPNWLYTGNAEVDGLNVALLENSVTGESVFLAAGDVWKQAVLSTIGIDAIVMVGPGGTTRRIRLGQQEFPEAEAPDLAISPTTDISSVPPARVRPELLEEMGLPTGALGGVQVPREFTEQPNPSDVDASSEN